MAPSVGDPAPDFELRDQHGRELRLSGLQGRTSALVVFYPWAFSGICSGELLALQARQVEIVTDDVALLAVSTDPVYALRAFADQHDITFPLLSDFWPHGAVASAYGVLSGSLGVALRGTFVVDTEGVVRWSVVNDIPDPRDIDDYVRALAAL